MGPFNLEPKFTPTQTCMGCKRARAAARGKPAGLQVISCGCLQHVVVMVVPELRARLIEAVDKWS